ncbi:superfamily I DNA/RNA helicase [Planoprotostelium fungivorum]|uniref:Superfamily I DNA/RNA helicase n=1 Tax=Planoprotostelium fungivorum TaxID=1890364 RepID=A0A2P6NRI3_9EUKA|nr:superfamily I DNA/RNA helicase [Planoprotostelium fungivorum]
MQKKPLSAVTLASYHHNHCGLFLQYQAQVKTPSKKAANDSDSDFQQAIFGKGIDWEDRLVERLSQKGVLLRLKEKDFFQAVTHHLQTFPKEETLYVHGSVFTPPHFQSAGGIQFSIWKPDFILIDRVEDRFVLTIVDAKSSQKLKVTHQVQLGYYWLAMQERLSETSWSETFQLGNRLGVWLLDRDDPQYFQVDLFKPMIESFIFEKLPRILTEEEPYWHYNPVCIGCPYNENCRDRVIEEKRVSSIPFLSFSEHFLLEGMVDNQRREERASTQTRDIEELVSLTEDPQRRERLAKRQPLSYHRMKKITALNEATGQSAVLKAANRREFGIIERPCPLLPHDEDNALYLILSVHPGTKDLVAYHMKTEGEAAQSDRFGMIESSEKEGRGRAEQLLTKFVADMSNYLRSVSGRGKSLQIYMRSLEDKNELSELLLRHYMMDPNREGSEHLRDCLMTVISDTDILVTQYQSKMNLSGAMKPSSTSKKDDLVQWINYNAPNLETKGLLVKDLKNEIEKIVISSSEGTCGRITPLLEVVRHLLAIPIVGYYDLDVCASYLSGDKSGENTEKHKLFSHWKRNAPEFQEEMKKSTQLLIDICNGIRTKLGGGMKSILPLKSGTFDIEEINIKNPTVKKMVFMKNYEMWIKLNKLRMERFNESGIEVVLRYVRWDINKEANEYKCCFDVLRGIEYLDRDEMFKWVLFRHDDPMRMAFNDLSFLNSIKPTAKDINSEGGFAFANVIEVIPGDRPQARHSSVMLEMAVGKGTKLQKDQILVMRDRLIDFNTQKVVKQLTNIDRQEDHIYLRMVEDPYHRKPYDDGERVVKEMMKTNKIFTEYEDLHNNKGGLSLLRTQNRSSLSVMDATDLDRALYSVVRHPLTLIWGPPGSGKTHTLVLIVLRLLQHYCYTGRVFRMVMTAFTDAAIDNFMRKLKEIHTKICQITDMSGIDKMKTFQMIRVTPSTVVKLGEAKGENEKAECLVDERYPVVMGGTLWSLSKQKHLFDFDLLLIDEGSQLPMVDASMAFNCIHPETRIVIAGDRLQVETYRTYVSRDIQQLPPILEGEYPQSVPYIYGSILDCFMRKEHPEDAVVLLKENFRMHPSLAAFTQSLYEANFDVRRSKRALPPPMDLEDNPLSPLIRQMSLQCEENRLATVMIEGPPQPSSIEEHLEVEAKTVADLIRGERKERQRVTSIGLMRWREGRKDADFGRDIFVITPHRMQRTAIKRCLGDVPFDVKIDTVERMQGLEASIVICCYSFTDLNRLERELDFIFHLRRINVALSRAQDLCVLLASNNMVDPPIAVMAEENRCEAFAHVKSFIEKSVVLSV